MKGIVRASRALVLGLLVLFFTSCENEVDITAEWKEVIAVYGLLDPLQESQYIKINKAFLNEDGSAYKIAQIPDSLFLDSADVTLTRLNTGQRITMFRVNEITKDSGTFSSALNYLYKTDEKIFENEPYRLEVYSPGSGMTAQSSIWTLGSTRIEAPFKTSNPVFSLASRFIFVQYMPAANAHAYDIKMKAEIEEYTKDTVFLRKKDLTWNMITNYRVDPRFPNRVLHQVEREAFMQFLASSLDSTLPVIRNLKSVSIEYYAGGESLVDYISVNEPSIGIVQKIADYSNVTGGTGLFGSRCQQGIYNVPIEPATIGFLASRPITMGLNFVRLP